jgi:hypothetical protein
MPVIQPAPAITRLSSAGEFLRHWWVPAALAIILAFAAFVRLRLLEMPLERDEGEYAYAGQLMLQGIPPYKLAYNMKLPGTYAAYAGIMAVFGQTTRGIHLGLILVNSLTILLVYFLGRRLFGAVCGVVAAAFFMLLSLSHSVLGLAGHATHFVTLFAMTGALLLWRALEEDHLAVIFWSGLCFGLAFVMKQQGIFFGAFGGLMLLGHEWQRRPRDLRRLLPRLASFSAGMCLPFLVASASLAATGVFSRFWFWTFSYARQYAAITPLARGFTNFTSRSWRVVQAAPLIWVLGGIGLALLLWSGGSRRKVIFLTGFLFASFATVCPGLYFREHYFITLLPAIALLAGVFIQTVFRAMCDRAWGRPWLIVPFALFLLAAGDAISRHRALFFQVTPEASVRAIYSINPFAEAREISRYIREHSTRDSRIAVLGSEPEICFYTRLHSATGYIYTYPLMELHPYALTMQQEMIAEIEKADPEYVVQVNVPFSWLLKPSSPQLILDWSERYAREHLEQVGFADILSLTDTEYHLGDWEGKYSRPKSLYSVILYKRKMTP